MLTGCASVIDIKNFANILQINVDRQEDPTEFTERFLQKIQQYFLECDTNSAVIQEIYESTLVLLYSKLCPCLLYTPCIVPFIFILEFLSIFYKVPSQPIYSIYSITINILFYTLLHRGQNIIELELSLLR